MSTHKCKQFIRPSPSVSFNHLPTFQLATSTSTSWKNYPAIPHKDSTSFSSPGHHLRFASIWQPPFAYGALLSQPRILGVSESVGSNPYLARHLSNHSKAHNHERHINVARENRLEYWDVEKAAEMVEEIAEAVEKVASMTEEISKDIEEEFPQDGDISKVAHLVEHLSEEVIKIAHTTHEFIHQLNI